MLKHTPPLLLSNPACFLLASLTDLASCTDRKQWEIVSCPSLYIQTIAASSFLLTFSHMVTLENSSLISLGSAENSLVGGCLLLSLLLLLTSETDLAWKGETCSELSACNWHGMSRGSLWEHGKCSSPFIWSLTAEVSFSALHCSKSWMVRPHAAAASQQLWGDVQCKSGYLLNLLILKERMFSQLCACCVRMCVENQQKQRWGILNVILLFTEVIVSTEKLQNSWCFSSLFERFLVQFAAAGAVQQQSAEISGGSVWMHKDAATENQFQWNFSLWVNESDSKGRKLFPVGFELLIA